MFICGYLGKPSLGTQTYGLKNPYIPLVRNLLWYTRSSKARRLTSQQIRLRLLVSHFKNGTISAGAPRLVCRTVLE
jgi:hypothetical protein